MAFSRTILKGARTAHNPGIAILYFYAANDATNIIFCHSSSQLLKKQRSDNSSYTSDREKGRSTSTTPQDTATSKYAM